MTETILCGDNRRTLASLPAGTAQCCVTSPPYYGLRDYGVDGQIGLEQTPDEYVSQLVEVFRGVWRVLRDDGTLWLNLGDSYGSGKQLCGIPWRVAFALQGAGWYLRSHIIWHKPNPMPESVKDRPTNAHESVFLLAKQERYFYDADSVREFAGSNPADKRRGDGAEYSKARRKGAVGTEATHCGVSEDGKRNMRNVWTIAPKPYKGAHFATMPIDLAERCILAGSKPGDIVLDPFGGAGTTAVAATRLGRRYLLTELNPEYISLARARIAETESALMAEALA